MESSPFQQKARNIVWSYAASRFDATDKVDFTVDDVYVVWFCKTLQNWKALLSTTLPDLKYYEVTHDGDKAQTYLDVYSKTDNLVVEDRSYSSGNWHMHSNHTGEKIEKLPQRISELQKERYRGDPSDLESMIPVVMGEGLAKQRTRGLADDQMETNRFLSNLPGDEVDRLGLKEVLGRMEVQESIGFPSPLGGFDDDTPPSMEYSDTDNGEANKVGFKDADFGLTDPDAS